MHEHLSKTAAQVIKDSTAIAREFGKDYVGTEHVLLSMLRHGKGAASDFLSGRQITEQSVRELLLEFISEGMEQSWVFGRLPGSPHFKAVVEHAIGEAQKARSKNIGTHHLLLGVLHETGSMGQRLLMHYGLNLENLRDGLAHAEDPA